MGTDLLCIVGGVCALLQGSWTKTSKTVRSAVLFGLLWLFGAIVTDLYRATPIEDFARGWLKVVVLIFALLALDRAARQDAFLPRFFWVGVVVGLAAKPLFFEVYGFAEAPWKFGLGLAAAGAWFSLLPRRMPDTIRAVGSLALAVLSLYLDFRSFFAILMLSAAAVVFRQSISKYLFGDQASLQTRAMIVIITVGVCAGTVSMYEYAAGSGQLGHAAQAKYRMQSDLGLSLLQAGRQETLVSVQAIADAPLLGHGSWAKDWTYVDMLAQELQARGAFIPPSFGKDGLVPSHSYILGAWVEHGVLAVPFWILFVTVCVRAIKAGVSSTDSSRRILIFLGLLNLWDMFFSPFGAQQRVLVAAAIVMTVSEHSIGKQRRPVRRSLLPSTRLASAG
ncbi:hypothetical protein ACFQPG_07665 [Sphingomonas sp. GCM10030256]|uniref:hypothetical protein n=1 Tax=Sphingomonas sp. GCM10030256 TaxID=3273427 RepID=UPI00361FCE50